MLLTRFDDGSSYISCSCETFNITTGCEDSTTISNCSHARLIKDITLSDNQFINRKKVNDGKLRASENVVSLPSKTGIKRYSIVGSDSSVSFVTIYETQGRPMVHCNTGRCQLRYSIVRTGLLYLVYILLWLILVQVMWVINFQGNLLRDYNAFKKVYERY